MIINENKEASMLKKLPLIIISIQQYKNTFHNLHMHTFLQVKTKLRN